MCFNGCFSAQHDSSISQRSTAQCTAALWLEPERIKFEYSLTWHHLDMLETC